MFTFYKEGVCGTRVRNLRKMLPKYQRINDMPNTPLVRIKYPNFSLCAGLMMLLAFFFTIVWSIIYNFEEVTFTHCGVKNYLPSISSAFGSYQPQKIVWKLSVLLHTPFRLITTKMYFNYYYDNIRRKLYSYCQLAMILNVIETVSLLCLSLWSSTDDYSIHKASFIIFIVTSEIYMTLAYYLLKKGSQTPFNKTEKKSLNFKGCFLCINLISSLSAAYFFYRHNRYCEMGMYSLFGLSEYIFVLTNIGFHMTAYWDFYDKYVVYDWKRGLHASDLQTYNIMS